MTGSDPFPRLTRRAAARRGGNAVIADLAAAPLASIDFLLRRVEACRIPSDRSIRAARRAHTTLVALCTSPIDPTGAAD